MITLPEEGRIGRVAKRVHAGSQPAPEGPQNPGFPDLACGSAGEARDADPLQAKSARTVSRKRGKSRMMDSSISMMALNTMISHLGNCASSTGLVEAEVLARA